ncbi:MAG: acylneuraminate cytidylyltransferase family protein [Lachnospiraceae bacterium]|nr:acylneuraminate cytidylyltransferase family protein [Lachnospiraceae bacterium]
MKNIAIIPARSGSKGVIDKNIKILCGKPLIAYTIEAALDSNKFEEVMVSTDSGEYAEIARKFGAKVPFLRSETNSSDSASSWDMVEEVLNRYRKLGREFDTFCLLQPTSPLRNSDDIIEAYNLYEEKADFAVVSVCEAEHSPLWSGKLPDNGEFINFIDRESIKRRQANGKYYRLNGAIYIVDIDKFKNEKFFYQKGGFAYIMPQNRSVDIDTELDFWVAEAIFNHQTKK